MSTTLLAIGASIAAFWNQARSFFQSLVSLVIRSEILSYAVGTRFLENIYPKCRILGIGNSSYVSGQNTTAKGESRDFLFSRKKTYIVFYGFFPALLSSDGPHTLRVTYILGTFPLKTILEETGRKIFSTEKPLRHFYTERVCAEVKKEATPSLQASSTQSFSEDSSFFGFF